MLWGEKPYFSLDYYLKQTFGSKTYKASLDAGFTCPNRDGTIGRGGWIFARKSVQWRLSPHVGKIARARRMYFLQQRRFG